MNVLSIDWDYFIDASAFERNRLFPDGGNEEIPEYIRSIIWSSHYMTDDLYNIKIKEKDFKFIKDFINRPFKKIMIADSHKHIYDFIKKENPKNINLTNIDFHNDLFNLGYDINCGNWVNHLMNDYECTYNWIKQKDSYIDNIENEPIHYLDLQEIKNNNFDFLYICRSGVWSPPHLDKYFNLLCEDLIYQKHSEVIYESTVFDDRYSDEFKEMVEANKKSLNLIQDDKNVEIR